MPKPYKKHIKEKPPVVILADDLYGFIIAYDLFCPVKIPEKDLFSGWFKTQIYNFIKTQTQLTINEKFDLEVESYVDYLYLRVGSFPGQIKFRKNIVVLVDSISSVNFLLDKETLCDILGEQ